MSLFGGMRVSRSALSAERLRLNVIAENIANAETTRTVQGGPYRRQRVILATEGPAPGLPDVGHAPTGVRVARVQADTGAPRLVYDPAHPDANAAGYVALPNVDVPHEMVDMMAATRAYEANALALQAQRRLQERSLELLA